MDSINQGKIAKLETSGCSIEYLIDITNNRLKVKQFNTNDWESLTQQLEKIAHEHKLDKIILVAQEQSWRQLFGKGYLLEAIHPSYFRGEYGYHMSYFLSTGRRTSRHWYEEDGIIKTVLKNDNRASGDLSGEYEMRLAISSDIQAMAELFDQVFASYPTPMNKPEYIQRMMIEGSIFQLALYNGKIISAASLDIDRHTASAELTDCATLPAYRGQGLMYHLSLRLENEALNKGLITIYSIARAMSIGINTVFAKHGYQYCGRFINNCDICGQFEDMNLWSKKIN